MLFLVAAAAVVAGCTGGGSDLGHWLPAPVVAAPDLPTVTAVVPLDDADSVAVNSAVTAIFSKNMDAATITTASFTLAGPGVTVVTGTIGYAVGSRTATFTPDTQLAASTLFTATVTTAVKDTAGNALASAYTWTFRTGAILDTTAPTVIATVNANGDTNVSINTAIGATFSEPMDPLTLDSTTFTLKKGGVAVAGVVATIVANTTFTPDSPLLPSTLYVVEVTTGAKDLAGNALAALYTWSWTTAATPDSTPPLVTFVVPADSATGVSVNIRAVSATFTEAINPLTITNLTFTVTDTAGVPVPGTIDYDRFLLNNIATFRPNAALDTNTRYLVTIDSSAADLAGNRMASNFTWTFRTAMTQDSSVPRVVAVIPGDGDTGVARNTRIGATFSEPMDPSTLTTATFTLTKAGVTETGLVTYSGVNAAFKPDTYLSPNTLYVATLTTGARDLAGNPLAADSTWSWTTGATLDTTAPTVILVDPGVDSVGVALNKTVSATFSEPMNPFTVTNVSFTLNETLAGDSVAGTTLYDQVLLSNIATFRPLVNLKPNTQYTATVTSAVEDMSGVRMADSKVWKFTTGTETLVSGMDLGAATPFGGFGGGAGITNEGIFTVINGDIGTTGASTLIVAFYDSVGDNYGAPDGRVNGRVYSDAPIPAGAGVGGNAVTMAIATAARAAAQTAWVNLSPAKMPGGSNPGANLAGLTLAPGIYQAPGGAIGTFAITGGDLTLDAMGDPNATFVFQMGASLTVGDIVPRSVLLQGGAQAKNVYWQVGSAATINGAGGGTMVGTIIADAGVTFSTSGNVILTTLNGRALGLNASVTMVNTVINVPAQ